MASHAKELNKLITTLREDRGVLISDSHVGHKVKYILDLKGNEERPFSDDELEKLLDFYRDFDIDAEKEKEE